MAGLILAVAEDDQRPASRLAPEQIQRVDDRVVERRAAPRREPSDRPGPRRLVGRAPGRREDVVVEPDHGDLVGRLELREEVGRMALHRRQRVLHAGADVDGGDELEGNFSAAKLVIGCDVSSS